MGTRTADATVVATLACVSFTAILPVTIAVLPACVAHRVAFVVVAIGGAVRISWALGTASAAVHSSVSLTPFSPITVTVPPACVICWGSLPIVAAGGAVTVDWALDATPTAVVRILACLSLTTIHTVSVANLHS